MMIRLENVGKKLVAISMSAMMVTSMMPVQVLADGEDVDHPVVITPMSQTTEVGNVVTETPMAAVTVINSDATVGNVVNDAPFGGAGVVLSSTGFWADNVVNTGNVIGDMNTGVAVNASMGGHGEVNTGNVVGRMDTAVNANSSFGGVTLVGTENVVNPNGSGVVAGANNGHPEVWVDGIVLARETGIDASAYGLNGETFVAVSGQSGMDKVDDRLNEFGVNGGVYAYDTGINVYAGGGATSGVMVYGDVITGDTGVVVDAQDGRVGNWFWSYPVGSDAGVYIAGDLIAEGEGRRRGVAIDATVDDRSSADIIVEGTIDGRIKVDPESQHNDLNIYAWQIETKRGETIVSPGFEKNHVNYIIKVDGASSGSEVVRVHRDGVTEELATISVLDDQGQIKDLPYAQQNQRVALVVSVPNGARIKAVYGGNKGDVNVLQAQDGRYIVSVPKGGGVSFIVEYEWLEEEKKSSSAPADKDYFASFNQEVSAMIDNAPLNGSISINAASWTGLTKATVDKLLARPDLAVTIVYVVDGVSYRVTIPAGADLSQYVKADGTIDFATLGAAFGAEEVK